MKKEDLKNKTTERLKSELKAIKIITGALIGVLTLLFIISIYGLIAKENNSTFIALIAVAISLSAILPIQFVNMKNIKNKLNVIK
ncbi:MAG: hypothetical protein IPN74_15345 [Haliscomenobacter sp.]|nr:hypothetical protein [Haliscomenobacter sp.]